MKINKIATQKLVTELTLDNVVTRFDLDRESFDAKDGTTYYKYFVQGAFGNRKATVNFMPNLNKVGSKDTKTLKSDRASYELLDSLFDGSEKIDMYVSLEEMTNPDTGEVLTYNKYTAVVSDDMGDRWLEVTPILKSDKAVMANLIMNQVRSEQSGGNITAGEKLKSKKGA